MYVNDFAIHYDARCACCFRGFLREQMGSNMDNVIHKFIEGLLILESLHAHIFNAFLFVNTDRENAEWDTLKIC